MRLQALPMRSLLCTIPAYRHAAPAPGASACVICEQQRAGRSLARLHIGEILGDDQTRQGDADRQQERLGGAPSEDAPSSCKDPPGVMS